ncbi:phosphatidylglycerol lysyltransferase domain-containing protein [Fundidesulfovibrio butyratiphilus]
MNRAYTPLTLSGREEYLRRLAKCPQRTSDYSFVNLWGWAEAYGLEWSFGDTHVWIRQTIPEVVNWAPVGPWPDMDWTNCPTLAQGGVLTRVPELLVDIWRKALPEERMVAQEARDHWDYVYSVDELVRLSGNRFHKKKNLLAQFKKLYAYDYRPLTPDCIEEVLQMQLEWCQWREAECDLTLAAENQAISRVVKEWDNLPDLLGGGIRVNGRMVAYTVAEPLDDDTLVIHFEKGHSDYKGVYQAINQMFLADLKRPYTWVNREQDLGDEGLRKAKTSYNPVKFCKKFRVSITGTTG